MQAWVIPQEFFELLVFRPGAASSPRPTLSAKLPERFAAGGSEALFSTPYGQADLDRGASTGTLADASPVATSWTWADGDE